MNENWHDFWKNYRTPVARSEGDLYLQVGKTINSKPIEEAVLQMMVAAIEQALCLEASDHLLDLCCGNGLMSYRLAQTAGLVTGVDFANHLIEAARGFKQRPNIQYRVDDVLRPIADLVGGPTPVTKVLMNDALAYFDPSGLDRLLGNLQAYFGHRGFRFLITGIPNHGLRWNFYDTPERRARFEEHEARSDDTNDGMGRWWRRAEIEEVCDNRRLRVELADQPFPISTYRMNALIFAE